jgi:hypothetical protein
MQKLKRKISKITIISIAVFLCGFSFANHSFADEACSGHADGESCFVSGMSQTGTCQSENCVSSSTSTTSGTSSSGIIPCGGPSNPCTICYMVLTIKNVIDFGFKIFVYIGILMIVIAGIAYIISSGNSSMMETAKGFLKNAVIGFAIMLGAWLIINTVMLVLGAKTNLGITEAGNWYTFKCIQQSQLFNQQGK